MRWPVQIQLLLPMLTVVVLAIALASGVSAYVGAVRARQWQEENFQRVVATLKDGKFPLKEPVLRQMSGLSGAEFLFIDENHRVQSATFTPGREDLPRLQRLPGGELADDPASADSPASDDRRSDGLAAYARISLAGHSYLGKRMHVDRGPDSIPGWLVVLYSEELSSATMRQAAYPALAAGAAAVLAVVVVTTMLAQRFVRPIRRLGDQTAAIAQGDFTPVAVGPRDDEIRDLAVSINRMTERLGQYEREVRRSEQLRTLGQLGAGMAHQLRNAATGGRMAIELHQRECPSPDAHATLDVALRQLRLMESYLQRLLTLSRPRPACRESVPLAALVDDVAALVRPTCLHAGIELNVNRPQEPLDVLGDPEELRQLVVNLVLNAVDAVSDHADRPATIAVSLVRLDAGRAVLSVEDSGPGPCESVAGRLFEPFVTGKPEGTGLGLFVARQIAEDHHGTLGWERRGGLTVFFAELPLNVAGTRRVP